MQIPYPDALDELYPRLASMVAGTSWLPHPDVVSEFDGAVFPTIRGTRLREIVHAGAVVGMYDDNATPEWSLFWTHNLVGTRPKGWNIAHVWPVSKDINAYTHLANLAMVPESFAGLTDKKGPLAAYLKWHAWSIYGWKPEGMPVPAKPVEYDNITWRYLDSVANPRSLVRHNMDQRDNQRVRMLRPIMQQQGIL